MKTIDVFQQFASGELTLKEATDLLLGVPGADEMVALRKENATLKAEKERIANEAWQAGFEAHRRLAENGRWPLKRDELARILKGGG